VRVPGVAVFSVVLLLRFSEWWPRLNLRLDQEVSLCVPIDQAAGGGACMVLESSKKESGGFEKSQLC